MAISIPSSVAKAPRVRVRSRARQRFFASRLALLGIVVLGLLTLVSVFGTWIRPYDPNKQSLRETLQGPSGAHWLGTDRFGRDILSRMIEGLGVSLWASLQAVVIAVALGIPIGLVAGYAGGW